jgi:hypothetical protein
MLSLQKNSHLIQLLIYAHCLNAPTGTECVLINCRTGECCRYVLTKSITAIDVLKVQSELQRIFDIEFCRSTLEKFIGHHTSIVLDSADARTDLLFDVSDTRARRCKIETLSLTGRSVVFPVCNRRMLSQ